MRPHLSYANAIATLALFVALGGSSYAALKLPRNSVGSAQIRPGAVHSSDLNTSVRKSLGGGGAGGVFSAAVASGGKALRGNATDAALEGAGHYEVTFPKPASACVYTATLGSTDTSETPAGRITVHQDGDNVGVQTYDAAGSPASLPFTVLMAC